MVVALNRRFISFGLRLKFSPELVPVPTEMISILSVACFPTAIFRRRLDPVAIHGRHQKHLKRGIVVHCNAAIDKDELPTIHYDDLGREVGRRGGAGSHELP